MAARKLSFRVPLYVAAAELTACIVTILIRIAVVYAAVAMWPYFVTFLAVAGSPLVLAGYGGHLATSSMPNGSKEKRRVLLRVWGLAIFGFLVFAVSQVVTYKSDNQKAAKEDTFRGTVIEGLTRIAQEPDRAKQIQLATQLKDRISPPTYEAAPSVKSKNTGQVSVDTKTNVLPSYQTGPEHSILYPEDFYAFVPYVWGFPEENTFSLQKLMIGTYQFKFRNQTPKPLRISYLKGDPSSYSLALFLGRVYGNAGWNVTLNPRTDIGYINGIYLFQGSIEIQLEGVSELRVFAKENKIPLAFGEQPEVEGGLFEIWCGKGPDTPRGNGTSKVF